MRKQNIWMSDIYHFVCDVVAQNDITVKKINNVDSPTNILIKPLPITKFKHCTKLICFVQ